MLVQSKVQFEKVDFGYKRKSQPKAMKSRKSKQYSAIYTLRLPIDFFFNKDGSFDGIGIDVSSEVKTTSHEKNVVKELCNKLGGCFSS
jgi:hypothetical protein